LHRPSGAGFAVATLSGRKPTALRSCLLVDRIFAVRCHRLSAGLSSLHLLGRYRPRTIPRAGEIGRDMGKRNTDEQRTNTLNPTGTCGSTGTLCSILVLEIILATALANAPSGLFFVLLVVVWILPATFVWNSDSRKYKADRWSAGGYVDGGWEPGGLAAIDRRVADGEA